MDDIVCVLSCAIFRWVDCFFSGRLIDGCFMTALEKLACR